MSKKLTLATLFHRGPATENSSMQEQANEKETLERELKTAEIETRFREALASGNITGDIITTDEAGKIVRNTVSTNIFEL